jgi:diacylglycerol kinase (ATP)
VQLVAVYGSFHLGQLQVGLSRALCLGQGARITLHTREALPMQVDGEPFLQPAGALTVERCSQALVLRRVASKPVARVVQAVGEVLDSGRDRGTITPVQHLTLTRSV